MSATPVSSPASRGHRKRVLLAWELGAGFGHTVRLAVIAKHLLRDGMEVTAAVCDQRLAAPLAQLGVPLLQAPPWPPPAPEEGDDTPATATLSEALARFGLRDPASVRPVLRQWRVLLEAVRPDLVICDYAPLAGLAARPRARVLQASNAFCQPPAHLEEMPILHTFAPVRHSDGEVLAWVNTALDAEGLPLLPRIGALFAGDDHFVAAFPLLDPYLDVRLEPPEGPLVPSPQAPPHPQARGIFAYLHPDVAGRADVLATLCALGPVLQAHIPLAGPALVERLRGAGVRLHARPVPLGETLARVRLVLHQGSAGIAGNALLAGRPQFTMGVHVEHHLNGQALAAAGVGRHVALFDPSERVDPAQVLAALEDEDLALVAEAAGELHRSALSPPPLEVLMTRCRALL